MLELYIPILNLVIETELYSVFFFPICGLVTVDVGGRVEINRLYSVKSRWRFMD